jgi:hypothetical protein
MQVNGFQIKQELKMIELTLESLTQELANSYAKFTEDTSTRTPKQVIDDLLAAERKKALYQTAQAQYNQIRMIEIDGKKYPLAYAIKLEGVINRIVKVWKDTSKQAVSAANYRHGYDPKQSYPTSQVDAKQCFENTKILTSEATKLQGIIGTGNSKEEKLDILG